MNNNMNINDTGKIVREQVTTAVHNIVSAVEPQINEYATKAAEQALDRGRDFAKAGYQSVRTHPMYLVGFAALLLVGAAVLLNVQSRQSFSA